MSDSPAGKDGMINGKGEHPVEKVPAPQSTPRRPGRARSLIALVRGRAVLISILGLLAIFSLLLLGVLRADLQPTGWDVTVTHEIQELPGPVLGSILKGVSFFGFQPWNWIIAPAIVVFMLLMRWFEQAAFTALAAVGGLLAEVVKILVDRPRPNPDIVHVIQVLNSYSFPSGHATGYTTLYGFIFYLAFTLLPRRSLVRLAILAWTGVLLALVGVSRVYMGQHWASDVVAGYALGLAWLLIVVELHRFWLRRRAARAQPERVPARG